MHFCIDGAPHSAFHGTNKLLNFAKLLIRNIFPAYYTRNMKVHRRPGEGEGTQLGGIVVEGSLLSGFSCWEEVELETRALPVASLRKPSKFTTLRNISLRFMSLNC